MPIWWDRAAEAQVVELPEDQALVSVRLRSMGGAVTGIAESASAELYNPAAMAVRRELLPAVSTDVDVALQVREHPLLTGAWQVLGIDPDPAPARRAWWQVASDVRIGAGAVAVHFRDQSWDGLGHEYSAATAAVGAGWAWPTLAVGALPEAVIWRGASGSTVGFGGQMGALWAPDGIPLRIGAGYRGATRTPTTVGPGPDGIRVPDQASIGASWSLGAVNQAGALGPARVQRRDDAPMLLLAADLAATGPSRGALPILPALEGDPADPIGWTFGVRAGAELWEIRHQVRFRGGFTSIAGRAGEGSTWILTTGTAVQVLETRRGKPMRATVGVEAGPHTSTFGLALESW